MIGLACRGSGPVGSHMADRDAAASYTSRACFDPPS